jgi:beta-lactamase class A
MCSKTRLVASFLAAVMSIGCVTRKPSVQPVTETRNSPDSSDKTDLLTTLLGANPQYFDSLVSQKQKFRIQIIFTQIDRKENNAAVFTDHFFNIDPGQYFYPASTVKMPTAILALQKLNELKVPGLDKNTTLVTGAAYSRQEPVYNDPNSADGRPTIANYIKQIFLVSDNDAFNRLYEFIGQEALNTQLHKMGYDSAQIIHRLNVSRTEDENRHTNPVLFYDVDANLIYSQPLVQSKLVYQPRKTFLGNGYYSGSQLINQPFDFSKKNRMLLTDLHSILKSVLFPEAVPASRRFNLTDDDYRFLYKYMSMKPGESDFPQYDTSFNGAYSKLLMYGGKGDLDPDIRIFNKEGDAYGFLTDVAYVVDFKNNVEFLLSASIYCNGDEIFNDDLYDYETVGLPFMKNLGQVIYQYELKRKKEREPDLSKFKFDYSKSY